MEGINPILESEQELVLLMSSCYDDHRLKGIVRYIDKELPDMYDHNFFYTERIMNKDDYNIF